MRTTSVRTEAGTIASITAHGPAAHPATAPYRGTCPVPMGSDLIDLLGNTAQYIAHTRTLLGVHACSLPTHVPPTLLLLTDRYPIGTDHPDCKNKHGTMHIDQVVRRASETHRCHVLHRQLPDGARRSQPCQSMPLDWQVDLPSAGARQQCPGARRRLRARGSGRANLSCLLSHF